MHACNGKQQRTEGDSKSTLSFLPFKHPLKSWMVFEGTLTEANIEPAQGPLTNCIYIYMYTYMVIAFSFLGPSKDLAACEVDCA